MKASVLALGYLTIALSVIVSCSQLANLQPNQSNLSTPLATLSETPEVIVTTGAGDPQYRYGCRNY